jgi:hypothetical protein
MFCRTESDPPKDWYELGCFLGDKACILQELLFSYTPGYGHNFIQRNKYETPVEFVKRIIRENLVQKYIKTTCLHEQFVYADDADILSSHFEQVWFDHYSDDVNFHLLNKRNPKCKNATKESKEQREMYIADLLESQKSLN